MRFAVLNVLHLAGVCCGRSSVCLARDLWVEMQFVGATESDRPRSPTAALTVSGALNPSPHKRVLSVS